MEDILSSPVFWAVVALLSELIALNPKFKSNSVIQLAFSALADIKSKQEKKDVK
tara:strand:- start:18 stop:179 length:162 start_codon:yes stop_codon:yes gene_type:complete